MINAIASLFCPQKPYPKALTSYDLLKSLALILMIVDHIGHFFYPEEAWFRVIGRLSVPIWFYLIGYADSRKVQPAIWIGGLLVVLSAMMAGEYVLPLSILFTLGFARLYIDRIMVGFLRSYEAFAGAFFLLFFLSIPTMLVFEYGALGVFFTVFGYLRKHKDGLTINRFALFGFIIATLLYYSVISSVIVPSLSYPQMFTLLGGIGALGVVFYNFKAIEFTRISTKLGVLLAPFRLMGRHTLFIYVAHLIVFRVIVLVFGDDRFGFFDFEIIPPSFVHLVKVAIG